MKIRIGCAWYPEALDKEQIKADVEAMAACGISLVRIGEFAWSRLEPAEGQYRFDWLHELMRMLEARGIGVVMSTPTSAAPPWLSQSHPEILKCDRTGVRAFPGIRDQTCYTSPTYRKYCAGIVEKMCAELPRYSNITAWQIDNEIGHSSFGQCHCEACEKAYRSFLREKYETLENLNRAWGNSFWSREFSDWKEISLADPDSHLDASWVLDSQIFRSRMFEDYIRTQSRIIRTHFPQTPVTTNSICGLADRYRIYRELDFAGIDHYPNLSRDGFARTCYYSDQWRNVKPGTMSWVTETDPAPGVPAQNRIREMLWNFIARGNSNILCFHWHRHVSGQEKYYPGLLDFNGKPGMFYRILQSTIEEINTATASLPELPPPETRAAILFDYENHWIYSQGSMDAFRTYEAMNWQAHSILLDLGVNSDIVSPEADFSKYRLLVIPVQPHITEEFAGKIRTYLDNGGTVFMGGKSGLFDGNAKFLTQSGPQHLQDVFGIEIRNGIQIGPVPRANPDEPAVSVSGRNVCFFGTSNGKICSGTAEHWISEIETKSARTLLTYENSIYAGMPFLTVNRYGRGNAFYIAADLVDCDSGREVMRQVLAAAELSPLDLSKDVEFVRRGDFLFFQNHNPVEAKIPLPREVDNLLGNFCSGTVVTLPPFGVALARIRKEIRK